VAGRLARGLLDVDPTLFGDGEAVVNPMPFPGRRG